MTGYTVDYSNRQLDIELLQHIEVPFNQRVYPAADHWKDGSGPRLSTGMEKVVQRYAKLFLTNVGSVKFDEHVGGTVITDIRGGKVWSMNYLSLIATTANEMAVYTMKKEDEKSDIYGAQPPDEKITKAEIIDLELDEITATVRIHVKITTEADTEYMFIVPVSSGVST